MLGNSCTFTVDGNIISTVYVLFYYVVSLRKSKSSLRFQTSGSISSTTDDHVGRYSPTIALT